MRAALLKEYGKPLSLEQIDCPSPGANQVLIRNRVCGICRTDLHIVDGELHAPTLPIVPGHQIVGEVIESRAPGFYPGQRVGVPWLGWTCGTCRYCREGQENLCENARFTGYHLNGGFADYCVVDARFCFPLNQNSGLSDLHLAPLLCAGLIGYRAFRMAVNTNRTDSAKIIGFYGFGSAARILLQLVQHENCDVYAVTRPADVERQKVARRLGAIWAGGSDEDVPVELDAAIIFAPTGPLVPMALKAVRKGGSVICAGIHMSDIPSFPYEYLWGERIIRSVANLTRTDGEEYLKRAAQIPIKPTVVSYLLKDINAALDDLRHGRIHGTGVIDLQAD